MQKRHVLVCEGSLCPRELPDVSGPGLGEAGRYNAAPSGDVEVCRVREDIPEKRLVLVCEGSLCPRKQSDVSGPGLGEAGRYT